MQIPASGSASFVTLPPAVGSSASAERPLANTNERAVFPPVTEVERGTRNNAARAGSPVAANARPANLQTEGERDAAAGLPAQAANAETGTPSDAVAASGSQEQDQQGAQNQDAQAGSAGSAESQLALSDEEKAVLAQLQARDREVRQHEAAHQSVGAGVAGAISLSFQRGPDGVAYAVGGEVPIDVSPVSGDPQATINKMRIVRAAALAPANPSPQDQQVAALASQIALQAQVELARPESPASATAATSDETASDQTASDQTVSDQTGPSADASGAAQRNLADEPTRRFRESSIRTFEVVSRLGQIAGAATLGLKVIA